MKSIIKYGFTWAVIMILPLAVTGQDKAEDPLEKYLEIAAENNPQLRGLFNQYLATLERMPQARSLPDPTVMFNVFMSPVETRVGAQRFGISITQAFPWFGQLSAQEQVMAEKAKAKYEIFRDFKNRLFYEVKSTYYDLYVLEAALSITEKNIRLLESFRELANVKLESGKGSAVDLLRVEMEYAELHNQLKYLTDSRLPLQSRFAELLNVNGDFNIDVPDSLITISIAEGKDVLLDSIIAQNPGLQQFDFEVSALESEIDVARKMGLPSFNLGFAYTNISERGDVEMPDNGKDAFIFPQVGVRIPLYRKKYQAMVTERELLKTSKLNQKESKENRLATMLEKTWRDYLDAQRREDLYRRLTDLANQSLDILISDYTSAGKDFEELLRMERQLLRYGLELEKARADQNTAVALIDYLTGK